MSAICNSRKYGTGVPLNVVGNPMDGKFEIVLNEEINLSSLLKAGLSSFDDKYYDNQSSRVLMTSKAELIYDEPRYHFTDVYADTKFFINWLKEQNIDYNANPLVGLINFKKEG